MSDMMNNFASDEDFFTNLFPAADFGSGVCFETTLRDAGAPSAAHTEVSVAGPDMYFTQGCEYNADADNYFDSLAYDGAYDGLCDDLEVFSSEAMPVPSSEDMAAVLEGDVEPVLKRRSTFVAPKPKIEVGFCEPEQPARKRRRCTQAAAPCTPSPGKKIKGNITMKTSHTTGDLERRKFATVCNPSSGQGGCGDIYFMKSKTTGDWSHTLCSIKEENGVEKYVACNHYAYCALCDPSKDNRHEKAIWNRSKFYNHRDKKHRDLVYANDWTENPHEKDGGLCRRVNEIARSKGYIVDNE